jgi:copper chaperone
MQNIELKVTGMTCGGCTNKVTQALNSINGVNGVNVKLAEKLVVIQYDKKLTDLMHLKTAIKEAGYGVDSAPNNINSTTNCCCG